MILQGLSPGFFAAVSDSIGRRPTYLVCFFIYVASNIGLALCRTFWLLMLLRAIQATGNSATVALGAGVIADIALPMERGGYLGIFGVGPLAGPSLGPVLGGALAQRLGWRSIFWFLAIFGGVFTVFLIMFLPETLRSIVGNGSVRPAKIWSLSLLDIFRGRKREDEDVETQSVIASQRATLSRKKTINILESFKIILEKYIPLILLLPSIFYTVYIMSTPSST
jgi:multidrug resistance protein